MSAIIISTPFQKFAKKNPSLSITFFIYRITQNPIYIYIAPEFFMVGRRSFPFGARPIFRYYLSFKEGKVDHHLFADSFFLEPERLKIP